MTIDSIVKEHGKRLFNLAYRIFGDDLLAEDLLQETLLEIHKALPSFRGESSLYSWAYKITLNTSLKHSRGKQARAHAEAALRRLESRDESTPVSNDGEDEIRSRLSPARVNLRRHFDKRCSWLHPGNSCRCETRVGYVLGKNPSLAKKLAVRTNRSEYNRIVARQLNRKITSGDDIIASFPLLDFKARKTLEVILKDT